MRTEALAPIEKIGADLVSLLSKELSENDAGALRIASTSMASVLPAVVFHLSQPIAVTEFAWRFSPPIAMYMFNRKQRRHLRILTATSGSIANLEVLLRRDDLPSVIASDVFSAAAAAGRLEVCVWLRKKNKDLYRSSVSYNYIDAFRKAAEGGHQDICKWFMDTFTAYNDESGVYLKAAVSAARNGHIAIVLDFLVNETTTRFNETMLQAARCGNLPVVSKLNEHGIPLTELVFKFAALSESMPLIKWLHGHGCPWDTRTLNAAIGGGQTNVEVVNFLIDIGCTMDKETFILAVSYCSEEVVDLLASRGCPIVHEYQAYPVVVVDEGNLVMLRRLQR
ncbi:hypothetical protein TSOC_011023, partial [Tetrabaena socialis]